MRRLRAAAARLAIMPFATAIAVLLLISGLTQLLGGGLADPVQLLLPPWEAQLLGWLTVAAGALMTVGMALPHPRIEAAGLVLLIVVVADRFLLYGYYLGFGVNFAVTGGFDAAIVWAAVARIVAMARGQVVVKVRSTRAVD